MISPDGLVPGVDVRGRWLGRVRVCDPRLLMTVPTGPANADPSRYDFARQGWRRVWPVDAEGVPCDDAASVALATEPPPRTDFRWSVLEERWVDWRSPEQRAQDFHAMARGKAQGLVLAMQQQTAGAAQRRAEAEAMQGFWQGQGRADIAAIFTALTVYIDALYADSVTEQDQQAAQQQFGAAMATIIAEAQP